MRITDYASLPQPLADDVVPLVDVHDTSQSAAGTTKRATVAQLLSGLTWKAPVQQVTTGPLPACTYASGPQTLTATGNGTLTVDGVLCAQGQRVLVSQQATAQDNGIYVVTLTGSAGAPWQLTRAPDMATGAQITGATVLVEQGSTQAGSGWFVEGAGPDTIGTTAIFWTKFTVIIAGSTPQPLGAAAPGTTGQASDAGHVHPVVAGQFLRTPNVYAPAVRNAMALTTATMGAWNSGVVCTGSFTAPPSGSVLVRATFIASISTNNSMAFGLAAAGTVTPVAGNIVQFRDSAASPQGRAYACEWLLTGLTAGTSYNFDLLGAAGGGATATVYASQQTSATPGLTSATDGGPVTMTVQAA